MDFNQERVEYWLSVGAEPSEPVRRLLGDKGVLPKIKRISRNPGVSRK
ncbi:MAG: 30S ribosomal protein S16, partial [Campylobacteraceae bacterium]|nr:30S ribosomal protein S16 [Campylobacteraceae bacterium]